MPIPPRASRTTGPRVPADVWARTQLLYVCSPDNPTGRVLDLDGWRTLFALADRHGFAIASDECYSEVYFDEARPPLGALGAARALGRDGLSAPRRVRQPVEALERAGAAFRIRRRGCAAPRGVPQVPHVSRQRDVRRGRRREHRRVERRGARAREPAPSTPPSSAACSRRLAAVLPCAMPEAAFYLWAQTPDRRRRSSRGGSTPRKT